MDLIELQELREALGLSPDATPENILDRARQLGEAERDRVPLTTPGAELALAGTALLVRKFHQILGTPAGDLDGLLSALTDWRVRLDRRDEEARQVRAELGLDSDVSHHTMLGRLRRRINETNEVRHILGLPAHTERQRFLTVLRERLGQGEQSISREELAEAFGMPLTTPSESLLRWARAVVEAYATVALPWAPEAISGADFDRFKEDFVKARATVGLSVEHLPDETHRRPAYEVIQQPNDLFAVLDLTTHMYVVQDALPERVVTFFLRLVDESSYEWLKASLEGALGGEPWSVIRVAGRRKVLDEWHLESQDHAQYVMTTVYLAEPDRAPGGIRVQRVNPVTLSGRKSSSQTEGAEEDLSEATVAARKTSGQSRTEASDLHVSSSIMDHSRSEQVSDVFNGSLSRIERQIFRETDAENTYGIYDVLRRCEVMRNATVDRIVAHFLGLVDKANADSLRGRILEALSFPRATGYHVGMPMSEETAEGLRRTIPASTQVLLTVDLTAPSAWEEPVELPDVTPGVRLRNLGVDTKTGQVFEWPSGHPSTPMIKFRIPTFEIIAPTEGVGSFVLRNLVDPSAGPRLFQNLARVEEALAQFKGENFFVAVPAHLTEGLINLSRDRVARHMRKEKGAR
jgi:hypothetical protein